MDLKLKKRIVGSMILVAAALIIVPLFFSHSVSSSELQLSADIPVRPAKPGNLALPLPSRETTVPASARTAKAPANNADSADSRIVFEQLQSTGSTNNITPIPTTAAPAGTLLAQSPAAAQSPQLGTVNNINAPQKASTAPKTASSAGLPVTAKATLPQQPQTNQQPQQTLGATAATPSPEMQATTPAANTATDVVSQPAAVTSKKPAKPNNSQTAKAKPTTKTKNTAPNPESWAVQLGSFSDKLNAENLMKKLQAEGFSAYTRTTKTSHGDLIRVLVGPELRRADADNLLAKLQKQLNLQGMVVKGG